MRKLSPYLSSLIEVLDTPNRINVLDQIGQSGEYYAIPYLLPLMESEDARVVESAEMAVSKLLDFCPALELAWMNEHIRAWHPSPTEWKRATERMMRALDQASFTRLSMSSMHWSGYVREAAVKRLAEEDNGRAFPFLLLRMNDWVPEIRNIARKSLEQRRTSNNAWHWIQNISLVDRLLTCGRDSFEPFVKSIHQLLRGSECTEALTEALASQDNKIRRFAYRASVEAEGADAAAIIEQALMDCDTEIRRWASQKVETCLENESLYKMLLRMKSDPVPSIRRESLALLAVYFPDAAKEILIDRLLDYNMTVRETARRYLNRLHKMDYSEYYLDVIWNGQEQHLTVAIAGLGETGQDFENEVLFEYSDHPSVSVRKAVLRGLAKLNPEPYASLFTDSLQSEQPGISREASRALRRYPYLFNPDELASIMSREQPDHVMRNALRLLPAFDRWKQLEILLDLLTYTRIDRLKAKIREQLVTWAESSNRKFTGRPKENDITRIHNKLDHSRSEMEDVVLAKIEWFINT